MAFWYLNRTTAFFCSVDVIRTVKRCSPASTTIRDVLGGILPRFSATMVSSCSLLSSSIFIFTFERGSGKPFGRKHQFVVKVNGDGIAIDFTVIKQFYSDIFLAYSKNFYQFIGAGFNDGRGRDHNFWNGLIAGIGNFIGSNRVLPDERGYPV